MNIESLFNPSNQFINRLGGETLGDVFVKYNYYPPLNSYKKQDKESLTKILGLVMHDMFRSTTELIGEYYEVWYDMDTYSFQWVNLFMNDVMMNAYDHSPTNTPFIVSTYFGEKGFGMGFYDGGDFYKDTSIQEKMYSKKRILSGKPEDRNIGFSGGNHGLYDISTNPDYVEIDTDKAILFCLLNKERLFEEK